MVSSSLHFENSPWFWGLGLIPLVWGLYKVFFIERVGASYLEAFIDKDLLPHLLLNSNKGRSSPWRSLALWSVLCALLMGALANPRWDYTEVTAFVPDQSVCILLDVSRSMDAQDIKPSRLVRARQKIEDFLALSEGMKVGLIAYAADPHMIAPLTDDKETLLNFLPSLGTDLPYVQGSRLSPALTMALRLLEGASGHNKSVVVFTDGGFEDGKALATARQLAQKGIHLYTIGVGTEAGALVPDGKGGLIKTQQGNALVSKLDSARLRELSQVGKGKSFVAHPLDEDVKAFIKAIQARSKANEKTEQQTRQWNDRFYLLVFPMLLLLLLWFRRGVIFPILLLGMIVSSSGAQAFDVFDFFRNKDQQGEQALAQGRYEDAREKFTDPYRQGVASYKAGWYADAERLFQLPQRPEVALDALYNLGNSLALQNKLEEAIKSYENVLEKVPTHAKAKYNLEVVKKLLEKQKEDQKQQDQNKDQDQEKQNKGQNQDQKSQDQGHGNKKESSEQGNSPQEKSEGGDKDQSKSEKSKKDESKSQDSDQGGSQSGQQEKSKEDGNSDSKANQQNQSGTKPEPKDAADTSSPSEQGQEKAQPSEPNQGNSESQGKQENKPQQEGQDSPQQAQRSQQSPHPGQQPQQTEGQQAVQAADKAAEKDQDEQQGAASSPHTSQQEGQTFSQGKPFAKGRAPKTQQDIDADEWLNQLSNDSKSFLRNQFYIESQTQGTQQGVDPW